MNEIINTNEINWIMSKATTVTPFSDADYTETSFTGNIPQHMTAAIKEMMDFNKDAIATMTETTDKQERIIQIKFGTTTKTRNRINFFFTVEKF